MDETGAGLEAPGPRFKSHSVLGINRYHGLWAGENASKKTMNVRFTSCPCLRSCGMNQFSHCTNEVRLICSKEYALLQPFVLGQQAVGGVGLACEWGSGGQGTTKVGQLNDELCFGAFLVLGGGHETHPSPGNMR